MKNNSGRNRKRENFPLTKRTSVLSLHFKQKPRKRVKNKEIKSLSQLVPSLGEPKISYFSSPCGTIECTEKNNRFSDNKETKTKPTQPNVSNSRFSNDDRNHARFKNENNKSEKVLKNNDLASVKPNDSIIKMKSDNSVGSGSTILQHFSEIRKSDNSGLSLLKSLMSSGYDENAITIEGTVNGKISKDNEHPVLKESRLNKQSIKSVRQCVIPPTEDLKNKRSHGTHSSGFVCSITLHSNNSTSEAKFYQCGSSKYLVLMKPNSNIVVIGTVEVKLLKGSLDILGYNLHKEDCTFLIFSPQGSSHLSLKAKDGFTPSQGPNKAIYDKLIGLGLPEVLSQKISRKAENGVLFTVTRHKTDVSSIVWPQFFEHHSSFSIFPNPNLFHDSRPCHIVERKLQCLFEANLQEVGMKEFNEVPEWSQIENDIKDEDFPKAILCGGKSVGKSSLLRYLVNKCLFKWKQILVLDFDLGQCEFTVPGCISATLVEEPLLGPNYSHLKEPRRSVFLGEVDVTKCPENYIEGCKSLIDYARNEYNDIPWLINTMGFTRGFGVSLACGIIHYVRPTHVVQIQSKDRKLNFPSMLEPKYVKCLKNSVFDLGENTTEYKLYATPSGSEQAGFIAKSRGISPAESRNLVILSYLSRMLDSNTTSLTQVTPYVINMELLELRMTNNYNLTKTQVAAAMNGNLVALCHKMPSTEFLNCRGFGIVRAVDWRNGTIFLITPLPPAELSKVNCLVKGNIGLPDSLYYNQGNQVSGHVPYLALTSGGSTARFAKRDFRNTPLNQRDKRQNR